MRAPLVAVLALSVVALQCRPEDSGTPLGEVDESLPSVLDASSSVANGREGPDSGVVSSDDSGVPVEGDAGLPPEADAGVSPARLRIGVISDLNGSYGSTSYGSTVHGAVSALTTRIKPDLILIPGDMVAGQRAGLNYAAMWSAFHSAVTTPLTQAGIPVAVSPGNHDGSDYALFANERAEYVSQWQSRLPAVRMIDATDFPIRYSFTHKGAFFVSIDSTTIGPLSAEQRDWIDRQLAAASAFSVKIVFGHVPIHPATIGRETEVTNDLELERIFRERGVTLFIGGHHHGFFPGRAGGVRQMGTACAGGGSRRLIGTSVASPQALAVIEVEAGRITALEALQAPDYVRKIERATLPAELRYGTHTLKRDDLP